MLFLEYGPTIPRDPESWSQDPGGKKLFEAIWIVVITVVASADIYLISW